MKIWIEDRTAYIDTPYHPEFVQRIKRTPAKWDPDKKVWEIDARMVDIAQRIMEDVYGYDGVSPLKNVSVRVSLPNELSKERKPVTLFGRIVATAFGRDSGATIGDGVVFEQGGAESGGSTKHWRTIIRGGSVIRIYQKNAVKPLPLGMGI